MDVPAETKPATVEPGIARDIEARGWSVVTDFLPAPQTEALAAEARRLWEEGGFQPAGVGGHRLHPEIRADRTRWLDPQRPSPAQRPLLQRLETLRGALNRTLHLGLHHFEGHLAVYPPGACYRRHLDNPRGQTARRVTVVFYLNPDWQAADGGQLRAYAGAGEGVAFEVLPRAGTLALFLSGEFEHEVLPAGRARLSLSGWFRDGTDGHPVQPATSV